MSLLLILLQYYEHPSEDVIFNLVIPLDLLDLVGLVPPSDLEGPEMSSNVKTVRIIMFG